MKHNLKFEPIGTHGDILDKNTINSFNNKSFGEIRKAGYYQEYAIRILDYNNFTSCQSL